MKVLETIKKRRSIRKYQSDNVPIDILEKIAEAGTYAPNAGGGQRTIICVVQNKEIIECLGKLNLACLDRSHLAGSYVSSEQPSIIDDTSIKSGFYSAPAVCIIFAPQNFIYSVPDAFCCAENITLAAYELGVNSCIAARAEETFDNAYGKELMLQWDIPKGYIPRCFVLLGYAQGGYPAPKPIKSERIKIIE